MDATARFDLRDAGKNHASRFGPVRQLSRAAAKGSSGIGGKEPVSMIPRMTWIVLLVLSIAPISSAQEAADFFAKKCKACHSIGGGRAVGPDLKDVASQKDRAWMEKFIQNPKAVIDSGDSFAVQLQQEYRGMVMPTVPGVTPQFA